MDIADRLRQKGFKVQQDKKTITVKSKWFCSVITDFSSSKTKFKYKFGKIDRIKSIIGSLILFSLIILLSLDSPFLPLYIVLFLLSLINDGIRFAKTIEIQKIIECLVSKN